MAVKMRKMKSAALAVKQPGYQDAVRGGIARGATMGAGQGAALGGLYGGFLGAGTGLANTAGRVALAPGKLNKAKALIMGLLTTAARGAVGTAGGATVGGAGGATVGAGLGAMKGHISSGTKAAYVAGFVSKLAQYNRRAG